MPNLMDNQRRCSFGAILALIVPIVGVLTAYAFVRHLQPGISDNYERYREFWGGNPSEVFSHWLDMVLMSGGAAVIAWLTSAEAFFRRNRSTAFRRSVYAAIVFLLMFSGMAAVVLDGMHGEGTVTIAYPLFFIPILTSSYYLLRRFAALVRWNPAGVKGLCFGFVVLHTAAQLFYEPSGTGGPNQQIIPLWLASVGGALIWAFVRSVRTGWLARFLVRAFSIIRRPVVWGSSILVVMAIGIPATLHSQRIRNVRQAIAFPWLDELEVKLTDEFIEEVKRDHTPAKAGSNSKIPVSIAVHALLADARIKGDNALRIYVPVNRQDYIFLWVNDRFEYCDVRQLTTEHTVEMDQGFIDDLMEHGGTYQTGPISILWSPYMAGRVLKDKSGVVKAICVINAPQ
jgi:hypothetical protein